MKKPTPGRMGLSQSNATGSILQHEKDDSLEVEIAAIVAVDRAVVHHRSILAAEAVGAFLRAGRIGPLMFRMPERRAA